MIAILRDVVVAGVIVRQVFGIEKICLTVKFSQRSRSRPVYARVTQTTIFRSSTAALPSLGCCLCCAAAYASESMQVLERESIE